MTPETKRIYHFGDFVLDAEQKLLFRDGQPVPLAPKAVETLQRLVENGGELVTKEELMRQLWPDAFVEEGNLAFNISVVRKTLGDDRNNGNRFIETIPKRGYRFIAPVTMNGTSSSIVRSTAAVDLAITPQGVAPRARRAGGLAYVVAAAALAGAGAIIFALVRPVPPPGVLRYTALTNDGRDKIGWLIVTDGLRVYFGEKEGNHMGQYQVSARGGALSLITPVVPGTTTVGISADQSVTLLEKSDGSLWTVGPPSGLPRRVGEIVAESGARWSPDRSQVAYSWQHDIYVALADGTHPRKLATAPGQVFWIRWRPDSKVLRFSVRVAEAEFLPTSIWEVSTDGSRLHPLLPGWREPPAECCGDWTADGRYYVFESSALPGDAHSDLWAILEKTGPFQNRARPVRLTSGPIAFRSPAPSPDGTRLFALGTDRTGELVVWDSQRKEFVPYLEGKSALWVTFSRDRSWIAFTDYATRTLWRMQADGTQPRQLSFEPLNVDGVAIAPDGHSIAFRARTTGTPSKIYLIPSEGGQPQALIPGLDQEEGIPNWSPDGKKIVFGDVPRVFGQDDGRHAIRIYDLETEKLSSLPGSSGLWTARWSPDGRYISAVTIDNSLPRKQDLKLYDVKKKEWRDLGVEHVSDPVWSHDSQYLYFGGEGSLALVGIFRVRISDGKVEHVASYGSMRRADAWTGLTPDDSPIALRNIGTEEIYALEVNWP